jgi:hypothetical protein
MDIVDFFLLHHARLHSGELIAVEGGSLVDQTLAELDDAALRARPATGLNSLAWLLWHMARSEDVYVNVLLLRRPQVLDRPEWAGRLRVERRDTGSGMAHEEVALVSMTIDIPALRAYRTAVGQATRAAIVDLAPEWWIQPITPAVVDQLIASGAFLPAVVPVVQRIAGRTHGGMLGSLGITHNALHLGEAQTVRSLL